MNRVMIVGSAGSGKSYLSKRIAEITGYPLTHLDNEFWQPGWVQLPKDQWIEKQKSMVSQEKWVIDGYYGSTMNIRAEAADTIIYLNTNRLLCMLRVLKRHGKKRSDLPDYCVEKMDLEMISFLKYIWTFPKKSRSKILDLHQQHPDKHLIIMNSKKEVDHWIEQLRDEFAH
ncbi:hypothetical protein [Paenibacillus marinisediminis]